MFNLWKNNNFVLISIGAIPASIIRWKTDEIIIVNIIGCFFLGFVHALPIPRKYKLIFGFGFCGSLTTFSGWSAKLFKLISQGEYQLFFLHSLLIVLISIFAIILGNLFAKKITN